MPDDAKRNEWVSLRDAAAILGVHPATIRNWADKGTLPSRRTAGGHRRFRRGDLEGWLAARQSPPPAEVQLLVQNALGRMRMHISEGAMRGLGWYATMPEAARQDMAHRGRAMLEELQRFLVASLEDAQDLDGVYRMGQDYARSLIAQGLTLVQAIEGFLVFSDFLHEAALGIVEVMNVRPSAEWLALLRQVRQFDDRLLLGLVSVYAAGGEDQA